MAGTGTLTLWKIIKEISVRQIRGQAERRFVLGLVGTADELAAMKATLLSTANNAMPAPEAENHLQLFELPSEKDPLHVFRHADLVFSYSQHAALLNGLRPPLILMDQGISEAVKEALEVRDELVLAVPRRFPIFREAATREVISATTRANAKIAVASALPGVIPATEILLPATSVGDIVLLTKNQLVLMFKIAAIYGKPLRFFDRFTELFPVVGGAFGWRALARELAGVVPGGAGLIIKGLIAYAGTAAVGKGAMLYYQGKTVSRDDIRRFYEQAHEAGRAFVESLIKSKRQKE